MDTVPGLQNSIDEFLKKLATKMPARSEESFAGIYSAVISSTKNNSLRCRIILAPYLGGEKQESLPIDITLPKEYASSSQEFLDATKKYLEESYKYINRDDPTLETRIQQAAAVKVEDDIQRCIRIIEAKIPAISQTQLVDGKHFEGLFSALNHSKKIDVTITPYEAEVPGKSTKIQLHIQPRYSPHKERYIKTIKEYLESKGYIDRTSSKADEIIIAAGTVNEDKRLNLALEKLKTAIHEIPAPTSQPPTSSFNGLYSAVITKPDEGYIAVNITFTPFIDGQWNEYRNISITIPKIDRSKADKYLDKIRECLEQEYALTPTDQPLTRAHIERRINGVINEAAKTYPNEFSNDATLSTQPKGLFTTRYELPETHRSKHNIRLVVGLRPYSDYVNRDNQYLLRPVFFDINTNTRDVSETERIRGYAEEILQSLNYTNFNLTTAAKSEQTTGKEIPKSWLKPERIRIAPTGDTNAIHQIILVNLEGRIPPITWSTSTRDRVLAENKLEVLRNELLPLYLSDGQYKNEPLTLEKISQYMEERFPSPIHERVSPRSDIRIVNVNGVDIIRLLTPRITLQNNNYRCELKFSPPNSVDIRSRLLDHQLNTSDRITAETFSARVQTLAEVVLTDYFTRNPNTSIVTTTYSVGKEPQIIYKIPEPEESPPPNQIFLRTLLDKHVKPALDEFNRYIYWHSEVVKLRDDSYEITSSARRNENNETLPEGVSPFQGPLQFHAKDEATALAFARRLDDEIIREQYLFSRERPVDSFGQTSMGVAIRESLRTALADSPTIETPNTHAFQTLAGRRLA